MYKNKSHHARYGFRNPFPTWNKHGLLDMLKWGLSRKPSIPDSYIFPVMSDPLSHLEGEHSITLTWIGHATFLIGIDDTFILTDPFFSDRASPVQWMGPKRMVPPAIRLEELPDIQYVLISHSHYDHLDYRAVKYLASRGSEFLVPLGLEGWFHRKSIDLVQELDWFDSIGKDELQFTPTPAQHFSARSMFDRYNALWCGWIIEYEDDTIYFAGDTGYFPGFGEIGERFSDIDIALLPIGAYEPRWFMQSVHTNPADAVQVFLDLGARYAVGMHWGTIKLTDEPLDDPLKQLGLALDNHGVDERLFITPAFGETVRYEKPVLSRKPLSMIHRTKFHLP